MTHLIRLGEWYLKSWNRKQEEVTFTRNIHQAVVLSTPMKDSILRFVQTGGLNPKSVDMK